jgi:hypothetical protein
MALPTRLLLLVLVGGSLVAAPAAAAAAAAKQPGTCTESQAGAPALFPSKNVPYGVSGAALQRLLAQRQAKEQRQGAKATADANVTSSVVILFYLIGDPHCQ